MLDLGSALDRIEGFRSGAAVAAWPEPVLVVAADGPDLSRLSVPPAFPAVVVAVSRAAPELPSDGPDVALTAVADPPRPWVGAVSSLDDLTANITATPGAAVTLAQLLRTAGRTVDVGSGRALEVGSDLALEVGSGLVHESLAYSVLQSGPEFRRWLAARPAPRSRPVPPAVVVVTREGDHISATLDRPEVHNAYNRQMRDELCDALAVALADPSCSLTLAGRGRSFCSGGDLDEFGTAPDPVTSHIVRVARSPGRMISLMADRVTAHLHGVCAGSGIEIPAFAGAVVADPDTRIWLPELAMGLIPGAGGTISLPRRIGRERTAWLVLSGWPVDAPTAASWGLVDAVG